MKCGDCGKPYMAGLDFTMAGNYLRCRQCYEKFVKEREASFRKCNDEFSKQLKRMEKRV